MTPTRFKRSIVVTPDARPATYYHRVLGALERVCAPHDQAGAEEVRA